jgi:hypothetical protein
MARPSTAMRCSLASSAAVAAVANWLPATPARSTTFHVRPVIVAGATPASRVASLSAVLYDNSGATTFAIGPGAGQDTVIGFKITQDTVQFSASLLANFAAAMIGASQVGANTVFTIDANDSATLQNVNMSSLTAGNFRFS